MTRVTAKVTPPGSLLKQPKEAKPKRKGMPPKSKKRIAYEASEEGKFGLYYMGLVRQLPCIICYEWGMIQKSKTEAHHPIHGRFATRKEDDLTVIPLCQGHHVQGFDKTKVELHAHPSKWKRIYGPDHQFIERTQDAIERLHGVRVRG